MVEKIKENLENLDEGFEIIEDDFKMVFDGRNSFHLFFLNKKKEWKLFGYNMQLLSCMKSIINHRINSKRSVLDFREYFTEYKRLSEEFISILTEITGHGY